MTRLLMLARARREAEGEIPRMVADYNFRVELRRQSIDFAIDFGIVVFSGLCGAIIAMSAFVL